LTHNFSELGLSDALVASLGKAGFSTPTPIQAKAIPPQLAGRDILGIAQTGSGKTAAFGLPILAGLAALDGRIEPRTTRALILAPTRELAVQIEEMLRILAGGMRLSTVLVLGGVSRHAQVTRLQRGVDVVIATPGRLKDLVDDKKLRLDHTRWLVLDEADRMLDMGFIKPVREIAARIGSRRQTALFSATMAPEIAALAAGLLRDPVRVEATPPATTVSTIDQRVILTPAKGKRAELNRLLADPGLEKVLVFARTKHGADRVAKQLTLDGHDVMAIHGNKSQNARQAALKGFAEGRVRLLVATDIAARGIDVAGITHVVNFDLPDDPENYVHRIGRTGRNGASGVAITLCDAGEASKLREVEKLIRRKLPATGDWHLDAGKVAVAEPRAAARPGAAKRGGASHPQPARRAEAKGRQQASHAPAGQQPRRKAGGETASGQGFPAWLVNGAGTNAKAAGRGKPRWKRGAGRGPGAGRAAAV
jgi:ATP-dependent RNA helicase RhlE